jgi:hypothetical protein
VIAGSVFAISASFYDRFRSFAGVVNGVDSKSTDQRSHRFESCSERYIRFALLPGHLAWLSSRDFSIFLLQKFERYCKTGHTSRSSNHGQEDAGEFTFYHHNNHTIIYTAIHYLQGIPLPPVLLRHIQHNISTHKR